MMSTANTHPLELLANGIYEENKMGQVASG